MSAVEHGQVELFEAGGVGDHVDPRDLAATEDWGSASSSAGALTARIERAGSELAALIDRSQPAAPADRYASVPSFQQLFHSR